MGESHSEMTSADRDDVRKGRPQQRRRKPRRLRVDWPNAGALLQHRGGEDHLPTPGHLVQIGAIPTETAKFGGQQVNFFRATYGS